MKLSIGHDLNALNEVTIFNPEGTHKTVYNYNSFREDFHKVASIELPDTQETPARRASIQEFTADFMQALADGEKIVVQDEMGRTQTYNG